MGGLAVDSLTSHPSLSFSLFLSLSPGPAPARPPPALSLVGWICEESCRFCWRRSRGSWMGVSPLSSV